nr:hypothetical protein OH826_18760 [Streptomyces sp. NBC_00899]
MSRYAMAKPYTLPESLAELDGPTTGTLTLPRSIDWGPHYTYDLGDHADLVLMYERVIREAPTPEDLRAYLHGPTLRRLWPHLFLPVEARTAWLARFPALGSAAAAA